MEWVDDDGGREAAGYKGNTGDCLCRAVAIVTQRNYKAVYGHINSICVHERKTKSRRSKSSARTGVYTATVKRIMRELGFSWVPTMQIGSGCTTHLRSDELPQGWIIVRLSKHYAAVIDGILHDTYDCQRDGSRCVYGYWYWGLRPDHQSNI